MVPAAGGDRVARKKATVEEKAKPTIDGSFFKDLADVIRAKNMFFVPFFGAFVAFLVAKVDAVMAGTWFFKFACVATFFTGIAYASVVSQLLWMLETLRFVVNLEKFSEGDFKPFEGVSSENPSDVKTGLAEQVIRSIRWENRIYRWVMWLLYFAALTALCEMYLRSTVLEPVLTWIAGRFSQVP